ncbi:MAG: bile acid:sodium symporter family protein [Bacteroidales bacterium]|nr:bile acid:sodium symporter family protein [Bacteroidales bacterium]
MFYIRLMQSLFSEYFLPVTLAIITMGMGLSLTDKDFRNIFLQPKAVIIGLCCQMVLLPLIAWLIVRSINIDPLFKVGLMIIAACPGGATSNLITYLLRGNVALSISMTAMNSIITLVTIPLVVHFSLEAFVHEDAAIRLNVGETVIKVFLITILPAFVGTRIRKNYPNFSLMLERPLRVVLPILLLLVYAGVIFIDQGTSAGTRSDFIRIFPYTLLLNILAMVSGFLVARILRLRVINQFTISIEVGLQNSALAIFVAATLLKNNDMALVPVVYGSFSFFSTLLFGWSVKKLGWVPKVNGKDT